MTSLRYALLVSAVLTLLGLVALDEPFAQWLRTRETYPAFWNQGIRLLEYPLGIEPYKWTGVWILAGGSILTLAIAKLRPFAFAFVLVTLVHLIARNASMWMKLGFGRLRPRDWFVKGGDVWFRDGDSFPSGHAVLFASIVVPLAVMYPRTRPLLAIVVFAMMARVAVHKHFLSDVLGGFVLVALITWACVLLLRRTLQSSIQPASLR